MGKHSLGQLFLLVIFFISLPLLLADTKCPIAKKKFCGAREDREIMRCCLEKYKRGFDELGNGTIKPGQDPSSCQTDLNLAECLSGSKCYANVTNALRRLILNQLAFTKRVKICQRNDFQKLLNEAEKEKVKGLSDIKKLDNLHPDQCATDVYFICGGRFRRELQNYPGFKPKELCRVFIREGNCNTEVAAEKNCTGSGVLNLFKANSNKAAFVVLPALCSLD